MSTNDPRPEDRPADAGQEPREPVPSLGENMDNLQPHGDPFQEADEAAAERPPEVQFPAGNSATVYDESPETPATVDPAQVRDAVTTTGTGSSIAIGCVVAAVVIVLIVILVLTLVS